MWWVITVTVLVVMLTVIGFRLRNPYLILRTAVTGAVRERIVRLPLKGITYSPLRHEIKIFNHLCLVMPSAHGVAVAYVTHMAGLLADPHYRPSTDPYDRLLYAYACAVLLSKSTDERQQRQLRKHLWFVFAPARKIVKRINPIWSSQLYSLYRVPFYKIFNNGYCDPRVCPIQTDQPLTMTVYGSYVKYQNANLTLRYFGNFYELEMRSEQQIALTVAKDKTDYDCTINRGVVTIKHLVTGESHTYTVHGEQVRLGSSLASATDKLVIYLTGQGHLTISVDHASRQLLTTAELTANRQVENIVTAAYQAHWVHGEKLLTRYRAAVKCVPSLKWLTHVVMVREPVDFFLVWDELSAYRRAAKLCGGFNLVFLYAASNRMVADLVTGFIDDATVRACQAERLLLFFIDRTTVEPDALYLLTKMSKPTTYVPPAPVLPAVRVTKSYPYVARLSVRNASPNPVTKTVDWPLTFRGWSVVSGQGSILTVVNVDSGRQATYHLPTAVHLTGEYLADHWTIPIKVKLAGYEQRQLTVTRHDAVLPSRPRVKDLVAALDDIQIKTADTALQALFNKPLDNQENPSLLALVKAAVKNVDQQLLLAVLADKHALPADVWQYLLTKVVGIRFAGGKIHLTPCVNLLGDFALSLTCHGEKYHFNTKKGLPSSTKIATITYG